MQKTANVRRNGTGSYYSTRLGRLYLGDSSQLLRRNPLTRKRGRVQLVFTSPPFPLNRKKRYGNEEGEQYITWLASFAPLLTDYLTPDGSIVLEVGNGWVPGSPTMSTLAMEALLAFKRAASLHLCQEFICYNPARLPSPAQWVTVERCRVKDAFTRVWWLSPVEKPKADNRRVLTEYSDSMRKLLERGTYNPGARPSEHSIGEKSFLREHGGAIPPNVLVPAIDELLPDLLQQLPGLHGILPIANTAARDDYLTHCRDNGHPPHPARMPGRLAEFFVQFLTESDDLVLDPFAGSNTTGAIAEGLGRPWIAIEQDEGYAASSRSRFQQNNRKRVLAAAS